MVKAMDKMRYPRKKGYAGRYVRHELGKNKLNLLLGCVFLLGALVGCQLAGQDSETILSQLGSLFSATGQSAGFLDTVVASFAANAVLLLILCLCGLGAVFQPLALGVLFWRGLGLGVLGVYSYSAGERAAVLYYLLVLLPQALLEVLLLVSAAGKSLRFSVRFFTQLLPERVTETLPAPHGSLGGYLAKFLIFYLLSGTAALLTGVLRLVFSSLAG